MIRPPLFDRLDPSLTSFSRLGHRIVDAYLSFWLFVSAGALFPLLASGGQIDFDADVSAMLRLLLLPGLMIAPVLVWAKPRAITELFISHPLLIALLLWVWASAFWSIDPSTTLRRALILTVNSIITCYIVTSYSYFEVIRKLFWVCITMLLFSAIFAFVFPELAFTPQDGRFRGIFTHKSVLGQCLLVSTFVFILCYQTNQSNKFMIVIGLLFIPALLTPTHSVTTLLLISLLFALTLCMKILEDVSILSIVILLFGISLMGVATLLFSVFSNEFVALLGRDLTLTGRTAIWSYMMNYAETRPFLGYGYRAFFDHPVYGLFVKQTFLFDLTGSHNGYLEMTIDLGLVGLAIILAFLLSGFFTSLRRILQGDKLAARFGFFWLLIYLGRNVVESDLLSQSGLSWTLALLAVLLQSRTLD